MELISDALSRLGSSHTHNSPFMTPDEADNLVMKYVFETLMSVCGAHKQNFDTQEKLNACKLEWYKAFKLAKLDSVRAIERGLDKMRLNSNPFMPTPGQFISMCREKQQPPLVEPLTMLESPCNAEYARKTLASLIAELKA